VIPILAIAFMAGAHYYNIQYHQRVKRQKQLYPYHTFWGPPNAALVVTNVNDGKNLIKYYQRVEKGENPPIEFPLLGLPTHIPVYVMGYVGADSLLVDVVSYWEGGGKSRNYYLRGYVYRKVLHEQGAKKKN
jgi:hypothetical protein